MLPPNKTKIVATIGPASQELSILENMLRAGLNIARINFSHGDFETHANTIRNIRQAETDTGIRTAIMADLPGPKIRIGEMAEEGVDITQGDRLVLTTETIIGNAERISVNFPSLPEVVNKGDLVYINDGYIQLEVTSVKERDVICSVKVGGELRSRKGLNLPDIDLGISAFTDHDRDCLKFAIEQGIDAVSQSFVEEPDDIHAVRAAAAACGAQPFIIAKIERSLALTNIDAIIDAADGIMIARGDLGVEVPIEKIARVQKDLVRRANLKSKPVITATQMLESMTEHRLPTRAEATDVANAILDGTDCVMLSGESAIGRFPVESVAMLARIAAEIEPTKAPKSLTDLFSKNRSEDDYQPEHLIAHSVEACLDYICPAGVFAPTLSGASARRIARFHLPVWVAGLSPHDKTCREMLFSYGVMPVKTTSFPDRWNDFIRQWVTDHNLKGHYALLTEGPSSSHPDSNHRLEIIELQ